MLTLNLTLVNLDVMLLILILALTLAPLNHEVMTLILTLVPALKSEVIRHILVLDRESYETMSFVLTLMNSRFDMCSPWGFPTEPSPVDSIKWQDFLDLLHSLFRKFAIVVKL